MWYDIRNMELSVYVGKWMLIVGENKFEYELGIFKYTNNKNL